MQITDLKKEQQVFPLLRLGFRPFFLFGAVFAIIAIMLWLAILQGNLKFTPFGGGYWWHLHEMMFGFAGAIIAGFLLTAVQNWTGVRGIQNKSLLFLVLLWLCARIVLLMPELLGQTASMVIDLAFFPAVAIFLGRPIIAIKQYRNLFFVPLLLLLTIINIQMYLAASPSSNISIQLAGYSGVMLISFLMSVMAGRVTPMFTANGTQTPKASPIPWLDKATNGSIALIALYLLFHPLVKTELSVLGGMMLVAAVLQLIRMLRWRPWITFKVPLLWSLHLSIICLAFGMLLVGLSYFTDSITSSHSWHLLTVGGMAGIILAMISRVSLGHTGRMLQPPKSMSLAFLLIFIAALVRSILPSLIPESAMTFYHISGGLWYISFGLFVYHYAPMLVSARQDGRPG